MVHRHTHKKDLQAIPAEPLRAETLESESALPSVAPVIPVEVGPTVNLDIEAKKVFK